jgi:lipopolysaccharide/colanic/teichoic acid biosynthesis glycosyltransferase
MTKRVFDVVVAVIGLVVLAPFLVLLAIWTKLDSRGPVLYRGERVGKGGRLFRIYKFRTMVQGAAQMGPGVTARGDLRITKAGRFLRKTKLDEFPQLMNVLRGEMSLVGPRPEDPRYVALYTPEQRRILSVRPGITSLASVQYRNEEAILSHANLDDLYTAVVMPDKLKTDLVYVDHQGFWSDLRVIAMTIRALFH